MIKTERTIQEEMVLYYTGYYRDVLGLRDWEQRVNARLNEERTFAEPKICRIEEWMNYDFQGKKVLVVGAGTGAELFALFKRGADVFGVEPDKHAMRILSLKADFHALPQDHLSLCVAEHLTHTEDLFDFVYCYTVLEHVRDVERSIDEMLRVTKPGGWIFINTPNYLYPYEGHYKLLCYPPALLCGGLVLRAYLSMRKRPVTFVRSLTFLTPRRLDRILQKKEVDVLRLTFASSGTIRSQSPSERKGLMKATMERVVNRYARILNITSNQYIFVKKNSNV